MNSSNSLFSSFLAQTNKLNTNDKCCNRPTTQQNDTVDLAIESQLGSLVKHVKIACEEKYDEVETDEGEQQTGVDVVERPTESVDDVLNARLTLGVVLLCFTSFDFEVNLGHQHQDQHNSSHEQPENVVLCKLPAQSILISVTAAVVFLIIKLAIPTHPS